MIAIVMLIAAQSASNKLHAAQALPPPSAGEQLVLAPINALFAAIEAKDSARIIALAKPEGRLTAVIDQQTVRVLNWNEYASSFKTGVGPVFTERLVGEPTIEIDRHISMVWAPYEFLADGKVVACGIDHFDLIRNGGQWKLLNVTWSQRKPGECAGTR